MKKREIVLLAGIAFGMLLLTLYIIVPQAIKRNFSPAAAFCLALLLWACSILAFWTCLRSRRRRRYSHSHDRHTTRTDYSDFVD